MKFRPSLLVSILATTAALTAAPAMAGKVLDGVKERGVLACGVHTGRAGFALADGNGHWSGLDVDLCRAVAAAVLGDANKVKFVPTSGQTRITALQSGEIDMLARNTTYTYTRDTSLGLVWAGINFYDGQAFMAKKAQGINSVKKLNGATVCVESGTTTEKALAEYFRANKINYKPVVFDHPDASIQAFNSGRCQAYTADAGALAVLRATALKNPENYAVLPEMLSKEPVGPAVRRGDEEWLAVVKWTLYAMIEAEELGINQKNVDQLKATSADANIKRMVGAGEDVGKHMGLDKEWTYRIIKQIGNYGDSFDRNLGEGSTIKLPRGLNRLWTQGGLMYAPPLR